MGMFNDPDDYQSSSGWGGDRPRSMGEYTHVFGDSSITSHPTLAWTDEDEGASLQIQVGYLYREAIGSRECLDSLREYLVGLFPTVLRPWADELMHQPNGDTLSLGPIELEYGTPPFDAVWVWPPEAIVHWVGLKKIRPGIEYPAVCDRCDFYRLIETAYGRRFAGKLLVEHATCPRYAKILKERTK